MRKIHPEIEKLRTRLTAAGASAYRLSMESGISQSHLTQLFHGIRGRRIGWDTLQCLTDAMGRIEAKQPRLVADDGSQRVPSTPEEHALPGFGSPVSAE